MSLAHVSLEEALDLITKLSGYQYARIGRTYLVGTPGRHPDAGRRRDRPDPRRHQRGLVQLFGPRRPDRRDQAALPERQSLGRQGRREPGGRRRSAGDRNRRRRGRRPPADQRVRSGHFAQHRHVAHRNVPDQVCLGGRSPGCPQPPRPRRHRDTRRGPADPARSLRQAPTRAASRPPRRLTARRRAA